MVFTSVLYIPGPGDASEVLCIIGIDDIQNSRTDKKVGMINAIGQGDKTKTIIKVCA